MPNWTPKVNILNDLIAEEYARAEEIRQRQHEKIKAWMPESISPIETTIPMTNEIGTQTLPDITMPQPVWNATVETPTWQSPELPQVEVPETFAPTERYAPEPIPTPLPVSQAQKVTTPAEVQKEKPVVIPFWQRAVEIFAVPFQWVDENIIKPGEGLVATAAGLISETERKPGEDFWQWKKRSWGEWKSPGVNINVPWSDEPLTLDARGVLEFAPWLLLPGAGQVGTGVRTGAGIAGVLAKAGRVGRILGTAVEYSPWGLAEKTAGAAIKGGFRAVGNVSEKIGASVSEKLYGKYVPPPVPESVTKLTQYFKEAVIPARKAFKGEIPELRASQEKAVQEVFASYRRGEFPYSELRKHLDIATTGGIKEGFALTPEALAARLEISIADVQTRVASGELSDASGKALVTKLKSSPAFVPKEFTAAEVRELSDMIINSAESGLVKRNSVIAFEELMLTGKLPQPHNIRDWKQVFGYDFAKAVQGLAGRGKSIDAIVDFLNIPRSALSSWDISATGRQGLILGLLHPTRVPVWFGRQVKALFSEKLAFDMDDALRARPIAKIFQSGKTPGYLAPIRPAELKGLEESYASSMAHRIPGVKRSERAFVTYLNESRLDAFEMGYNVMKAQGATEAEVDLLRNFINLSSGRGILPKALDKYAPALNAVLFSPRLQASLLELPYQIGRMLLSDNPYMRKEAAKALVTFVGGGVGILSLLNASGNKIEIDPRSADFGKIKIGETRLDIWRGYLQYARFAAQMLTEERKSAFGNMNKAERAETAWRFLQSKSSPVFGMMVDLLRNENYMGKPIFNDTTGFSQAVKERALPLAVQDIIDATEQSGINGFWAASPSVLGVGALTMVNDFVRVKNKIAKELGYEKWSDIDPKTQREIQNRNTELQTASLAFDRQVMGTAWGDWKLAGNAIEDVFRQNVDMATNQYKQTQDGYQYREKIRDAFTARRGAYDVREKEARFEDIAKRLKIQDTVESLVALGPEQIAIKSYNDALFGDDMYDEFGDYRFDEADIRKQQLRQSLGDAMFNYVEDYRELKFETFPPEFQELQKARQVLKPYWAVADNVERLYGKAFIETTTGKGLIQRLRRNVRLSVPQVAHYYDMFYKQI